MKTIKICTFCGFDEDENKIIINLENTRYEQVLWGIFLSNPCPHCNAFHPPWVCLECYKTLLNDEFWLDPETINNLDK